MILGLMGHSRSGKDAIADYLGFKYNFAKMALADPMKRFCKEVFAFSDEQLWGESEKRNAPDTRYVRSYVFDGKDGNIRPEFLSPRIALQLLGTEWGRICYQDVWVEYTIRMADKLVNGEYDYDQADGLTDMPNLDGPIYRGVVIPDVRFTNELNAIKRAGGKVVRVRRDGADGNVGIANHTSETEQKLIPDSELDGIILNNINGLENLYKAVDEFMKSVNNE